MIDVKRESVFDYVKKIKANDGKTLGYRVMRDVEYYSHRYKKHIKVSEGDRSDGATFAKDLNSFGWLIHDELCSKGVFKNGDKCSNLQASHVLTDIMKREGYWFRTRTWFWATWLFGGGKARKNGMI